MPRNPSSKWEPRLGFLALLAGLVLATYPAWGVLTRGRKPSLDELLKVVCTRPAAGPPAWLRHDRGRPLGSP